MTTDKQVLRGLGMNISHQLKALNQNNEAWVGNDDIINFVISIFSELPYGIVLKPHLSVMTQKFLNNVERTVYL
jgi:hypothetical protein